MKDARKQETARRARRRKVNGCVAESQAPFFVKIGVRSWKAKRVPVGRRLARLAVLVRVCEIARWEKVGGLDDGDFGVSGSLLTSLLELELGVDTSGMDGCLEEDVVLGLRDMLGFGDVQIFVMVMEMELVGQAMIRDCEDKETCIAD